MESCVILMTFVVFLLPPPSLIDSPHFKSTVRRARKIWSLLSLLVILLMTRKIEADYVDVVIKINSSSSKISSSNICTWRNNPTPNSQNVDIIAHSWGCSLVLLTTWTLCSRCCMSGRGTTQQNINYKSIIAFFIDIFCSNKPASIWMLLECGRGLVWRCSMRCWRWCSLLLALVDRRKRGACKLSLPATSDILMYLFVYFLKWCWCWLALMEEKKRRKTLNNKQRELMHIDEIAVESVSRPPSYSIVSRKSLKSAELPPSSLPPASSYLLFPMLLLPTCV